MAVTEHFYDALAPFYHLIYPNWEASSRRQSHALVELLHEFGIASGSRVLDAAAGIGTQALGLAAAGYGVAASDVSPGAIHRLEREAANRHLFIRVRVADLRTLSTSFDEQFDAVLACDNAIPHLEFRTRYYAVTIARLLALLADAGFERVERRDDVFFQPLIVGVAR